MLKVKLTLKKKKEIIHFLLFWMDSTSNAGKQREATQLFGQPPHSPPPQGDGITFIKSLQVLPDKSLKQIQPLETAKSINHLLID